MKQLLNDMSFEERQNIREQHTGGMKVMSGSFRRLVNAKLGDSKPLISEQPTPPAPDSTIPTPPKQPNDGKKEYINEIRSLLSSMENSGEHNADTTAQIIVNNTNYFLTRQKKWSDINKYGKPLFSNSEVKYLNKN